MRKNISKITALSLLTAALVALPALSRAEGASNSPSASDQTPAKPKKHDGLVFRGTVSAIDVKAMTLTVETRTFAITSDTKIIKAGKSATLADGVVGEQVSGTYKKTDDGKLAATNVHFGAKVEKNNKEASGAEVDAGGGEFAIVSFLISATDLLSHHAVSQRGRLASLDDLGVGSNGKRTRLHRQCHRFHVNRADRAPEHKALMFLGLGGGLVGRRRSVCAGAFRTRHGGHGDESRGKEAQNCNFRGVFCHNG